MALFDKEDIKIIIISASTTAIGIIIATYFINKYLTKKAATEAVQEYIRSQHQQGVKKMSSSEPKLHLEITTSEYYNNEWNPVIKHTFMADTPEELKGLINAHKQTDSFFRASFDGSFKWKGKTIQLRNEEPLLLEA